MKRHAGSMLLLFCAIVDRLSAFSHSHSKNANVAT